MSRADIQGLFPKWLRVRQQKQMWLADSHPASPPTNQQNKDVDHQPNERKHTFEH